MNGGDKGQSASQPAGWVFKPGGSVNPDDAGHTNSSQDLVEWTASEYVAHEKSIGWHLWLVAAAVIVAALVYLITRDTISTGVVLFAAVVFAVTAARKPRVLAYRVDQGGLTIGQKYYPYSQFKSFAVLQEGAFFTLSFLPLKRFSPSVDIHVPPDNAEAIMNVLTNNLALEPRRQGLVDTLTHRIRY